MIDTKSMAYVNMYGVLGTLENLCQIDASAKANLAGLKKPVSLCFSVKDGPCCTFHFTREDIALAVDIADDAFGVVAARHEDMGFKR